MISIRFGVDVVSDCVDTMCYQRRFTFWLFKWYTETHYRFNNEKNLLFQRGSENYTLEVRNTKINFQN